MVLRLCVPLIKRKGRNLLDASAERLVDRDGQEFSVAERVGDAVRGDGVTVIAGVAHERPARTERLAYLIGLAEHALHRRGPASVAEPLGQLRGGTLQQLAEGLHAGPGPAPGRPGVGGGRADPDACLPVVGREHSGERPVGDEELDAGPLDARVVGVLGRAARRARLVDLGSGRMGHPRPQAVGADHVPGADVDGSTAAVMPGYARHPAAAVPPHAGHGDFVEYLGAGPLGGGREDRVQHVPPGRDDKADPGLALDRAAHRLTKRVERDLPDGRGTAVQDRVQQPPALELDHAAACDRMRRDGVARKWRLVHDQHVTPEAGQQHGGSRSGGSAAHDDDIAAAPVRVHGCSGEIARR
jgi:hypothetical protein